MAENFLKGFVDLCSNSEIPPIFALWSGVAGISCALGRRVWIDLGRFSVYPNMYILLVAGSGRMRKSTSIDQITRIITKLEPPPNLIAQKITPESFIQAMRGPSDPKKLLAEVCTAFGFADEMATFLNKASYEAGLAALLITFFDCKDRFEYRTKGGGREILENVCFGLLAASTLEWVRSGIPEEAVGGGLTSRIIFVYSNSPPTPVAIPTFTDPERLLLEGLIKTLHLVSRLDGEVKLTQEAWDYYKEIYEKWNTEGGEGDPYFGSPHTSGYASRMHIHLLKLGTIFAASELSTDEGNHILVRANHLVGARQALRGAEQHLQVVMSLITASDKGADLLTIQKIIEKRGTIPRSDLTRLVSSRLNSRELSDILDTLTHAGRIRLVSDGKQTFIQWIG